MSHVTEEPAPETIPVIKSALPSNSNPQLRKVGGVILPSKTWVPFVAGALGGMGGAVLTAPLDVVKTRLQSDFYRDRLQASRATISRAGLGVWRHVVETSVILRHDSSRIALIR